LGNGWCRGCVDFRNSGLIPEGQFRRRQAPKKLGGDQDIAVQQKNVPPNVPKEATRVHKQAIKRQLTVPTSSVPKPPKKTKLLPTVSIASPVRAAAQVSRLVPRIQPSTSPDSNAVRADVDAEQEGTPAQPFYPSVAGSPSKLPSYAATGSEFDLDPSESQLPKAKNAKKVVVASGASARPAGPVPRALSKTLDANGQPLSHIDLKKLVTDLNLKLPKCDRSTNVAHLNISQLDDWVVKYYEGKRQTAAMLRVTATVKVEVCMRMLALLADTPELLALFKDKCGGSSQHQIDAGAKPLKNTGLGMNLNHAYWPAMVQAFNDSSKIPDFPFEYVVDEDVPTFHSNGVDHVSTPAKMKNGFFAGLGIKQPRIPEGFYDGLDDFKKIGSTDMEDHCTKQVDALKADLLARDLQQHSPVTFGQGQGGNTPRTPLAQGGNTPRTPLAQGGNTPRTPLTPHNLTLSAPGTPAS
jgi:hypothetical protein